MKQAKLLFLLIAALAFASCRPTARQTVADAEQPTDSTEALTSADTLRLVIIDKSISRIDSLTRRTLRLPLDSIVVEMMNNTDRTCMTGEAYTIEQRVNDMWTILPIKPRKDGLRTRSTQHPPVHYPRRFRQIRLRARTGIPHRQRTFQIQTEQSPKRLLLFYNRISVPLSGLFAYLSLFLILALMLLTDTRFTSRIAAMVSSSKCRSSCMMRKMY